MKWHVIFETIPPSAFNNFLIGNVFKILKMGSGQ